MLGANFQTFEFEGFSTVAGGGLMRYLFIYLFICLSCKMTALMLCYHFIAPCIFKGDISASAIYYLWGLFLAFYFIRGRLGVLFIHLFVYICRSYRMVALMLCYNSMAPSTCRDDISSSAICHFQRFS